MKITWLGQAGLLFEVDNKKILIDPYLSNGVEEVEPHNVRRVPIDQSFLTIKPDVIVITHSHLDHFDKKTLRYYLDERSNVTVLAPSGTWQEVRKFRGLKNNYVLFDSGTIWSEEFATFRAVNAVHSDKNAIGIIICVNGKNYYITGDTLYSERVLESVKGVTFDYLFLPINGVGNNMNALDARLFSQKINAKNSVPIHYGMFDDIKVADVELKNKKILQIYKTITTE